MRQRKYLILSDREYSHPQLDTPVRLAYNSENADLFTIPAADTADPKSPSHDERATDPARPAELVAKTESEFERRIQVLERQRLANKSTTSRGFVLMPSQWCNLGCDYCGQEHFRRPLARNHRETVERRVTAAIEDKHVRQISIGWFGGEPMLGFKAITELTPNWIEHCAKNETAYVSNMITNGTLLSPERIRTLVDRCQVSMFDITVDGPADIHDSHRPSKSGGPNFSRILQALRYFRDGEFELDPSIIIRVNVDKRNANSAFALLDTLASCNLTSDRFEVKFAPVYEWSNDVSDVELQGEEFAGLEVELMHRMLDLGLNFTVLPEDPVGATCSATTQAVEVDSATGNVFSCTEFPLVPEHEANDALTSLDRIGLELRPLGPFDDWTDRVERGEFPCSTCEFLPVCGGACPKQWLNGRRACPSFKYNVQARFDVLARMNGLSIVPD